MPGNDEIRHLPDRQQHKSLCRGYGDIAELAGKALIEAQRMLVSMGRADCEAIIHLVVGDTAALANESLTAPLNVEMIEQGPSSR